MQISRDDIRRLLDYSAATGVFTWRERPREMFKTKRGHSVWNARYSGTIAGSITKNGYRSFSLLDGAIYCHRAAWLYVYGWLPDIDIDHVNGNKDDNRISNLRIATRSENIANSKRHIDSASGHKGVSLHKRSGKWRADICLLGRQKFLGCYDTREEAAQRYREAASEAFGQFARDDRGPIAGLTISIEPLETTLGVSQRGAGGGGLADRAAPIAAE
jgi:hypothetical protein